MATGLFLATSYNQSQLSVRKHVARYWSINTAATAVPLSAHPSPLVITTKLAAAILGGPLFGVGVLPAHYCPCGCYYIKSRQADELNVCWNNVYRRIFNYNKWESVKAVILGLGRLNLKHFIMLIKINFYRYLYTSDNCMLRDFFWTFLSLDGDEMVKTI